VKLVTVENGTAEVRWMWLPTFIGQNLELMRRLDAELVKYVGHKADKKLLSTIHADIVEFLCREYPIPGLRKYLNAIEFVED